MPLGTIAEIVRQFGSPFTPELFHGRLGEFLLVCSPGVALDHFQRLVTGD